MQYAPDFGRIAMGGPGGLAQIERSDESRDTEDECWEECSDDEDCFLECLAGEPGQVTSHGHGGELAQIAGNSGGRSKGKGLAQISRKGIEPPKEIGGGLAQTGSFELSDEDDSDVSDAMLGGLAQVSRFYGQGVSSGHPHYGGAGHLGGGGLAQIATNSRDLDC